MKKLLTLVVLLLSFGSLKSQDFLDELAQKTCDCLDNSKSTTDPEQMKMKMGLCLIENSVQYKSQLKKEYGINLDKIDKYGKKLGKLVGMRMATQCPKTLLFLTGEVSEDNTESSVVSESKEMVEQKTLTGTIKGISEDGFVVFSIQDEAGKMKKFYWTTFIQSSTELTQNYSTLDGKVVTINYIEEEFFDPKIKEYRTFSIITKLNQ